MFRKKPQPVTEPPQWLIAGLGNPGPEYRGTRHNVGFEVIDRLAQRNGIRIERGRDRALVGMGTVSGLPALLVKPMTFMNLSGQAIGALARRYSLKPERVLVIADDLDLDVGRLRLKEKGSAGGHNGHKSVIASLRSQDYPRFKIGIGKSKDDPTIDHVLSGFPPAERAVIDDTIDACVRSVEVLLAEGLERTQNAVADYNSRFKPEKESGAAQRPVD